MKNILFVTFMILAGCHEREETLMGRVEEIPLETRESGNAFLIQSDLGHVYLSWLEYENESKVSLRLAQLNGSHTGWEDLGTVNSGNDWFVNWADFPSVVPIDRGRFIAHWLQYSGEGTYDYDIRYSISNNNGRSWSAPLYLNDTTINAEYGFATIKKTGNKAFAVWLDGRHMAGGHSENHQHQGSGDMNLRSAYINRDGFKEDEVVLDDQTCDCCNTEVIITNSGPLVAYRNKSDGGVRDIHIMQQRGGEWLKDSPLHRDNWHINGCPVNGPAGDGEGDELAIAWFSGAADSAAVNLKLSHDGGKNFGPIIKVSNQKVLGRVDVIMHKTKGSVYVSWMESKNKDARLKIAEYNLLGEQKTEFEVASMSGARKSGFPRMVRLKNELFVVYTDVSDLGSQRIRTLKIN